MTKNPREEYFPAKQEGKPIDSKILKASSSSRPWAWLKDPRIVRVSRSLGGKDRHSKVCTIRGLRDRRVRLSVPTAIQLYDLQDRLGLNQPSKVVDWLLDAARHEIDELPPLQMPPGNFGQYPEFTVASHKVNAPQSSLASLVDADMEYVKDEGGHSLPSSNGGLKINNNVYGEHQTPLPKSTYWNFDEFSRMKRKEVARETISEKGIWMKRNVQENQEGIEGLRTQAVSVHNSCPQGNSSSKSGLRNNFIPYNSYYHWEPSNVSLSQLEDSSQKEDPHNYNVLSLPSSLSVSSGSHLLEFPSGKTPSSFAPSSFTALVERDLREINYFQLLSSSSQKLPQNSLTPSVFSISPPVRPSLTTTPKILRSQNHNGSQPNKDNLGSSSTHITSLFQNRS